MDPSKIEAACATSATPSDRDRLERAPLFGRQGRLLAHEVDRLAHDLALHGGAQPPG
jgi:hypothetical protein